MSFILFQKLLENKIFFMYKKEFIRFLLIGCLTFFINIIVIFIAKDILGLNYKLSVAIGFIAIVLFNFFGNKIFTFRTKSHGNGKKQFCKYLIYVLFYYALTILIIDFMKGYNINFYIIMILSTALLILINFLIQKIFIFNKL